MMSPVDDSKGIVYFSMGTKHAARLMVSLYSLRKHYDGPVTILHGVSGTGLEPDEFKASEIALRISDTFDAEFTTVPIVRYRRHTAYVAKAGLWRYSPYGTTIFLDADTVIAGSPTPLWTVNLCVLTFFAEWVTTGNIIGNRLKQWENVECQGIDVQRLLAATQSESRRALNTGVFAYNKYRARRFLQDWEWLTAAGWRCSFTDELAAQLLAVDAEKYGLEFTTDKWNYSPLYGKTGDPVIYHLHGHKHVIHQSGRGKSGHAIWWPLFAACWQQNLAGVQSWAPAGDKFLQWTMREYLNVSP